MNVGELIEALQKYPKDVPICVDNNPIYFTDMTAAYWDGRLQQIIHDEELRGKSYSIIGWKITDKGSKVVLRTIELEDVLLDNPDLPVEYDLDARSIPRYKTEVEAIRVKMKEIIARVDTENEAKK